TNRIPPTPSHFIVVPRPLLKPVVDHGVSWIPAGCHESDLQQPPRGPARADREGGRRPERTAFQRVMHGRRESSILRPALRAPAGRFVSDPGPVWILSLTGSPVPRTLLGVTHR